MFFFILIHAASVYLFNLVLKHYIKRLYKRLAFQKQIYIITLTSYLPKIFQQLDQIPMWDGHIAAVTVLDTDQEVESPYFMVDRQNMFRCGYLVAWPFSILGYGILYLLYSWVKWPSLKALLRQIKEKK